MGEALQVDVEFGTGELGFIEAVLQHAIASNISREVRSNVCDEVAVLSGEGKRNAGPRIVTGNRYSRSQNGG
jgi:hypothetical protein